MANLLDQAQMKALFLPLLEREGKMFQKVRPVWARPAQKGERIETHTADGLETVNTAQEGDVVVRNTTQAGEMYLMSSDKFAARYEAIEGENVPEGFSAYQPIGRITAIELTPELLATLGLPAAFTFTASWGSEMSAKQGDYLACPEDGSSVYRIARQEFFETYRAL